MGLKKPGVARNFVRWNVSDKELEKSQPMKPFRRENAAARAAFSITDIKTRRKKGFAD